MTRVPLLHLLVVAPHSSAPWSSFATLLSYRFMVNALLAGTIVAILSAIVGWYMVLRRQTFAGHTLAVVGFPGAAGAALLGLSVTPGYLVACVAAALAIGAIPRTRTGAARATESAIIGTIQAFALACGVLFVNLYHGFLDGVTALLFGSFLGITSSQVITLGVITAACLIVLGTLGRPLLFASIDGDVASARGLPVRVLNIAFLVLLGLAVAEVSEITGSLLVFALLVMPAAAAQRLTNRAATGLALSVSIAVGVTWTGLIAAYYLAYPVGFYLTSAGSLVYLAAILIERKRGRASRRDTR